MPVVGPFRELHGSNSCSTCRPGSHMLLLLGECPLLVVSIHESRQVPEAPEHDKVDEVGKGERPYHGHRSRLESRAVSISSEGQR